MDPETDLQPRLLATVFGWLVSMANCVWRINGGDGIEPMAATFDPYAEQLGPALAGHWNAQAGI